MTVSHVSPARASECPACPRGTAPASASRPVQMLSLPCALLGAFVPHSWGDDTLGAGRRLPPVGVEVRLPIAGDAMSEMVGHRSCEVDQLSVENMVERFAAVSGARLQRAKDVLRQTDSDGPEREQ